MLAVIGGTGFESWQTGRTHRLQTPFGQPSTDIVEALPGVLFLARHGVPHRIPPHRVNYRANLWALREAGAARIIAINAVGGITDIMAPGVICIPDQIVDYTWGREHTFSDSAEVDLQHIDFGQPYSESLRRVLLQTALTQGVPVENQGVYAATQGPRLETAAEIEKLRRDGCDLVGMTGMPEAALARELELDYASVCVVANWAAGLVDEISLEEIHATLATAMDAVVELLQRVIAAEALSGAS